MEKYLPGGYLENRRRLLRAVATMAVAARARASSRPFDRPSPSEWIRRPPRARSLPLPCFLSLSLPVPPVRANPNPNTIAASVLELVDG